MPSYAEAAPGRSISSWPRKLQPGSLSGRHNRCHPSTEASAGSAGDLGADSIPTNGEDDVAALSELNPGRAIEQWPSWSSARPCCDTRTKGSLELPERGSRSRECRSEARGRHGRDGGICEGSPVGGGASDRCLRRHANRSRRTLGLRDWAGSDRVQLPSRVDEEARHGLRRPLARSAGCGPGLILRGATRWDSCLPPPLANCGPADADAAADLRVRKALFDQCYSLVSLR
jgi:hypothetical protein